MGRRKLTPNITNPRPPAHPQYLGRAPAVIGYGQDKVQRAGVFAKVLEDVYEVVCCAATAEDYDAVLAWGGGHFACSFAWKSDESESGSGRRPVTGWGMVLYMSPASSMAVWEKRAEANLKRDGGDCGKRAVTFPFPCSPIGNLA